MGRYYDKYVAVRAEKDSVESQAAVIRAQIITLQEQLDILNAKREKQERVSEGLLELVKAEEPESLPVKEEPVL